MKGDIHFHDADYSPFTAQSNCSLPNFWDMLANGFTLGNAPMASPKSIAIAATQITQIMKDVASSQYGGQTANRADEHFAAYAKKDYDKFLEAGPRDHPRRPAGRVAGRQVENAKANEPAKLHFGSREPLPMDTPFHTDVDELEQEREILAKVRTRKSIYDAMQTMEYQINSNRVSNGQTPFVTVGFGLGTDWFAREVQRAILLNRIRGLGSEHHTAIFPKLVFTVKPRRERRPRRPELRPEAARPGMRHQAHVPGRRVLREYRQDHRLLQGADGLPLLPAGLDRPGDRQGRGGRPHEPRRRYRERSAHRHRIPRQTRTLLEDVRRAHGRRPPGVAVPHHALQAGHPVNAPTLFRFGAFGRLGASGNVDTLFKNERATVSLGYIGLAEATAVFYGKDWIRDHGWDPQGKEFALSIVKRMSELCKQWSKAEGYHYSVYSTPAESLTDRFNRMDREKFGEIEGVTDHDFYTNSFHYPVWLQPTPMEKLNYEKDFPYFASGGFINYCEYPCLQDNPKALEAVWDYAYNIGIGYLGTNTPIDHCFVCGFQGDFEPTDEGFKCPECGNSDPDKCNVTKRTCGYLGNPVQRPMVHGRHEEISAPRQAHERRDRSRDAGGRLRARVVRRGQVTAGTARCAVREGRRYMLSDTLKAVRPSLRSDNIYRRPSLVGATLRLDREDDDGQEVDAA